MKIIDKGIHCSFGRQVVFSTNERYNLEGSDVPITLRHRAMSNQLRNHIDLSGLSLSRVDVRQENFYTAWQFTYTRSKQ